MLAGPILKGDVGAAEGKRCLEMVNVYLSQARASDSNQQRVKPTHTPAHISARS